MNFFKPAHKEDNPDKKPGQIMFRPETPPPGHGFTDQTLADYIARKRRQDALDSVAAEKKMTFEEWFNQSGWAGWCGEKPFEKSAFPFSALQAAWKAAQENK